ncbi:thiol reductant ABC exporter subunit CydD [Peptostreptococcus russellii]|uniref:thiol reductant ABC exporter subunit CydD n=1 Tax=Peptostreptococcus russellii TaxID=215200 RepID=UPI001625078E|nr:thiol reductant ABC exporter subunit CydD [Peptostreptococcus russellii]MBC2578132.1 thiol reductant ABC exporter subunit CydD [Peptostreptococcus russellii]
MIDKQILKIKGMKSLMGKLVGISFLQALFILFQGIFLSKAITNLFHGESLSKQIIYILLFAVCFVLRHLSHIISEASASKFSASVGEDLRKRLMRKIYRLGPCLVQKEGTATLTVAAMEGISNIENYISIISIKIVEMMILPVILIISIFYYDLTSGIILVLVFPIVIVFMALFGNAAKAKADKQFSGYKLLSNHFLDSLQGLETLKIIGKSEKHSQNVFHVSEDYRKATMSTLKIAILSTFALDFFTTLSIAIVAVFLGLRLLNGQMLLYPAMTVLILAPEFFFPLRQFAEDYHATLDGKNAMKDLDRIENMTDLKMENKLKIGEFKVTNDIELEIKNLSYKYEDNEKYAIKNINYSHKGFAKIGIIGYSGSGKSTLLNIIGGFLQAESGAKIRVNNVEMEHFTQEGWQNEIIYIPQNPYIFSGTILDNMRFYSPNATLEELIEVSKKVGLYELIDSMEDKFNTKIGEGGRNISGGQAQRIAIARAFLSPDRKILLLDEPTAHLDIETEVELKKYILELAENRLMFFSTHRLHWMKDMDDILVISNGELIQSGSYDEINNEDGEFIRLAKRMRGDNVE